MNEWNPSKRCKLNYAWVIENLPYGIRMSIYLCGTTTSHQTQHWRTTGVGVVQFQLPDFPIPSLSSKGVKVPTTNFSFYFFHFYSELSFLSTNMACLCYLYGLAGLFTQSMFHWKPLHLILNHLICFYQELGLRISSLF